MPGLPAGKLRCGKKKGKKRLQKKPTYEEYIFREVALFLRKFVLPAKTKIKNKEQKKEN